MQYMHNKMGGNEAAFAAKYMLGDSAGEYASELMIPAAQHSPQ